MEYGIKFKNENSATSKMNLRLLSIFNNYNNFVNFPQYILNYY